MTYLKSVLMLLYGTGLLPFRVCRWICRLMRENFSAWRGA